MIFCIVAEKAGERKVKAVQLTVGKLSGVEVKAIQFCFGVCAQGTVVEGAELQITEPEGLARCQGCDKEFPIEHPVARCPCERKARMDIVSGQELLIASMET